MSSIWSVIGRRRLSRRRPVDVVRRSLAAGSPNLEESARRAGWQRRCPSAATCTLSAADGQLEDSLRSLPGDGEGACRRAAVRHLDRAEGCRQMDCWGRCPEIPWPCPGLGGMGGLRGLRSITKSYISAACKRRRQGCVLWEKRPNGSVTCESASKAVPQVNGGGVGTAKSQIIVPCIRHAEVVAVIWFSLDGDGAVMDANLFQWLRLFAVFVSLWSTACGMNFKNRKQALSQTLRPAWTYSSGRCRIQIPGITIGREYAMRGPASAATL